MATLLSTLAAFTHFLTAYTHTLLCLRTLYPRASFVRARFHNTAVYQSRHPLVCEWIRDAIAAVRDELLAGSVARIAIVIYNYDAGGGERGSARVMERYMVDVGSLPVVDKRERNTDIEWDDARGEEGDSDVDVDLSEQFRAALVSLTSRCAQLAPLPSSHCSFNISLELKDEPAVDPPLPHPQPWVPVQPSLQKTGRKGAAPDEHGAAEQEGRDLGGAKVTPVRTVEAGVFRFETWIEEAKAKFDMRLDPEPQNRAPVQNYL
ncbi:DNA-binding protein [Massarina eburnea CBS 473.64]|uniref:DNA-binding protein n=1 Tax=Massarina eburnea CBS 473.64 TaxID=1395130 RepID=A0A6A6RRJ4_9PLEO|nr:DNA-binding protein [Massarina eburnea CBS 473.64]